jgi:proteasome beta subunit
MIFNMDAELKNSMLKTGTTILGIVCKDGVVMAADRRGTVGNMIYSKHEKVKQINDYLVYSGCGFSTEIQKAAQLLTAELKLKDLRSKSRPSVKKAASLLSTIQVQASAFLLAGFDQNGDVKLYDILGGFVEEVKEFSASIGSGMPFALGFLERQYKKGLSVKEGIELAKEALKSSTSRDEGSGNGIDIYSITKDGIKKEVAQEILPQFKDREE